MNLVQRVKDILLDPRNTWPRIDAEAANTASIFNPYVMALAAIGPVAGFIGLSLVGMSVMGAHIRMPIVGGLVQLVVGYAVTLVMVYVMGLVVNALAPSFGGRKNPLAALKVVAYGSTAAFVGGVFNLFPVASLLGLLAALYSVYLFYLGLPVLMKCPEDKAIGYTAVVVICGIVAAIVIGGVSALFSLGPRMTMGGAGLPGSGGEVTIKTPQGEMKIDTAKMEAMAKKMEAAGKQAEADAKAAQADGKPADPAAAAAAVLGAMAGAAGGAQRPVMPAAELKALLPETLGELKRESFEAQSGSAMGIATANAKGEYRAGERQIRLEITDTGGLAGLMAVAGWANMTTERETDGEVEKVYKDGTRTVREEYRKDGSRGELTWVLPNGILVQAEGQGVPMAELKAALGRVDVARLEAVKAPAK